MKNPEESVGVEAPAAVAPLRLDGAFERQSREDWERVAGASLGEGESLDELVRHTLDGMAVRVLYDDSPVEGRRTPSRAEPAAAAHTLADKSGEGARRAPSGAPASSSRRNRLRVLGDDARTRNAHALAALAGGVGSLEIDVRVGDDALPDALPLDSLVETLSGIHLDMITLSLRCGDEGEAAFDALLALCEKRGLDASTLHAELDVDPLGTLAAEGHLGGAAGTDAREPDAQLPAALERLAALAGRAADTFPQARVVAVDTSVHHEAGASIVQELVAGIASATLYLESMLTAGLTPESACRTLVFRASLDANLLDGVVKLRSLERLWRHVLIESGLPVQTPFIVAETSRRHLSRLDSWVNHLRNVSACTAAMIGGADVLLVHPHDLIDGRRVDEAMSETSDRVARNLVPILDEEGGLWTVADAAGGAHAIESLTQATVEAAWAALGELQDGDGFVAGLLDGRWQAALARTHAERVERLRGGDAVMVGVNRFRPADAPSLPNEPETAARNGGGEAMSTGIGGATGPGRASGSGPDDGARERRVVLPLTPVREAAVFETTDSETPP